MSIVTYKFWTLQRVADSVEIRLYVDRTELIGDDARHVDTMHTRTITCPVQDVGRIMVENDINEFSLVEDAEMMRRMS